MLWLCRCDKKRDECEMYFDRYDLDESGTVNDAQELKMMAFNLVKANGLSLSLQQVRRMCTQCGAYEACGFQMDELTKPAMRHIEVGGTYTLDQFMIWFYDNMVCHVHTAHIDL